MLVTGGAGYIGAHVVHALQRDRQDVAVLDDLSTGIRDRLNQGTPFYQGSVLDADFVVSALREHRTEAIVHVAAKKAVEESVQHPLTYYLENVVGMHSLLSAMTDTGVSRILFSSSAAVYGVPSDGMVTEQSETAPASPYGWTKLMCEQMLRDTARAHELSWVSLRYFNVAGATDPVLGDRGVNNLVPKVFRAISSGQNPQIFGDNYPTEDGTCVRDYIHVEDVAEAHAAAIQRMAALELAATYNIGTGSGTSVLAVMQAVQRITGIKFKWDVCGPREGDPARVVADPTKIRDELGWRSRHDLDDIIGSAWNAWCAASAGPHDAR
ncbi:UDP-glucose 4-epimerase GalE [Mycobacterium sp. GA-1285]|uniref:UDP-glucose 4-epimerase GalE n=1 Tax=Mycobacterium sp. GA-1285 TaxID=1772282 RepID=UPI00210FB7E7|nr:UDP-glucose 4-epimerase GalE [Mycobacterium sp. GA-1285]